MKLQINVGDPRNNPKVIPGHISALDGLRAFAIIAVIFHHCGAYYLLQNPPPATAWTRFIENLGSGVDLFFALSGFLITGILLDSLGRPYFFRRFYWRRGLRIWPLYYTFLIAAWMVHRRVFASIGFAPFAFYYRNFLGPDRTSDVYIGQFWSLCVEEQFYLLWPLVLYFVPKRLRMLLITVLIFLALLLRIHLFSHGGDPYVIYRLPYCHMDVLLAGAAVAVLIRQGTSESIFKAICATAALLGVAGIVLLNAMGPGSSSSAPLLASFGLTGTSLLFGGIVGLCARTRGRAVSAVLGSPFLRAISTRSYAMYVFHLVPLYTSVVLLSKRNMFPVKTAPAVLLIFGIGLVTYALAWLSWRYPEAPFLRLKKWEWFVKAPMAPSGDRLPSE